MAPRSQWLLAQNINHIDIGYDRRTAFFFFFHFEHCVSSLVSFGQQNNVSIDWQSREANRKKDKPTEKDEKKTEAIKRRMEKLGTVDMKLIIRACIYY